MFGIGMPELIVILVIALIVIGPKKLPDLAKSLGRAINEFKKATREFKDSMDMDEDIKTLKKPFKEISDDLRSQLKTTFPPATGTKEELRTKPESELAPAPDIAETPVSPSVKSQSDQAPDPYSGNNINE